jgi:predicted metalloprotease
VTFRRRARLDPSQVQDLRGRGPVGVGLGGVAVGGGGIGLLVIVVLALLGGGDLVNVGGPTIQDDPAPAGETEECRTGADANARQDCRIVGFVNSIQAYWDEAFAADRMTYRPADTRLFDGQVQTACGVGSSASGPFYCPADGLIYLDLGFLRHLQTRFGAQGGPLAEGYVVAHEYGHHVQGLLGVLQQRSGGSGPDSVAVRIELQADCYAGVWAANAVDTGYLEPLTDSEVQQALDAAAAVGDDRIQERATGHVEPDSWTHGSARERQEAFATGYRDGAPEACET